MKEDTVFNTENFIDEINQLFLWSFLFKKGVDLNLIDTDDKRFLFTQEEYEKHWSHFPAILSILNEIDKYK